MQLTDLCKYPQSRTQRFIQIGVLVSLITIANLPFTQKAYHIDDFAFLEIGRQLFDFDNLYSKGFASFGDISSALDLSHPLVVPYIIHFVMRFVPNASAMAFHGVFLIFTVFAAVFTYLFCLRFTPYPFIATLCFFFSPAFFVVSQNVMCDGILYFFIISSLVCFIHAVDHENKQYLAGAMILFALAIGTGFQSMVFCSAFFLYSYFRQPRKLGYSWAMGLSLLPTFIFFCIRLFDLKRLPSPLSFHHLDETGKMIKYLYFVSQTSLAYLAPIGLTLAVFGKKQFKTAFSAGLVASVFFLGVYGKVLRDYAFLQKLVIGVGLFFTILAFGMILRNFYQIILDSDGSQKEKNDLCFLVLTTLIFYPICLVFTPFASNRYLIPIMIFIIVLILRKPEVFRVQLALVSLVVTMVISLYTAKADYDLAGFYKKFAREIVKTIPPEKGWFLGEWGIRYYMSEIGYKYLTFDSHPAPHDMIVEPMTVARMDISRFTHPLRLKKTLVYQDQNLLKVLHFGDHAGFWSQGWGLLPFWFSKKPLEEIRIYEAMPEVIPFNLLTAANSFTLPADLHLETRVLGGQAREALLRDGNQDFVFSLQPPEPWRLQFGLGLTSPPGETEKVSGLFKIIAVSFEEKRKVLFEKRLQATPSNHSSWVDAEIDLTEFKGQPVKLIFQVSDVPKMGKSEAFWSSLNLVETRHISLL